MATEYEEQQPMLRLWISFARAGFVRHVRLLQFAATQLAFGWLVWRDRILHVHARALRH